jgi:hypothetical protein
MNRNARPPPLAITLRSTAGRARSRGARRPRPQALRHTGERCSAGPSSRRRSAVSGSQGGAPARGFSVGSRHDPQVRGHHDVGAVSRVERIQNARHGVSGILAKHTRHVLGYEGHRTQPQRTIENRSKKPEAPTDDYQKQEGRTLRRESPLASCFLLLTIAQPYGITNSCCASRTVSTGQGDLRTTFSATLPRSMWAIGPRPWVPITMRSTFCAFA